MFITVENALRRLSSQFLEWGTEIWKRRGRKGKRFYKMISFSRKETGKMAFPMWGYHFMAPTEGSKVYERRLQESHLEQGDQVFWKFGGNWWKGRSCILLEVKKDEKDKPGAGNEG